MTASMYLTDGGPWSTMMLIETSMRTKAPRTAQSIHHELALDDDAGETDVPVLLLGLRRADYQIRTKPMEEPTKWR